MLRTGLWLVLLLGLSCKACASCVQFSPPNQHENEDDRDSGSADTADTADTALVDTGPPPPCALPEVEPNDSRDQAMEIPREVETCGVFSSADDREWLVFPGDEAAWFQVRVRAAAVGSAANVVMLVADEDYEDVATVAGSVATEDPRIVFPTLGSGVYYVYLYEGDGGYGEDFDWYLMASETKPPVEWDWEEEEPDDSPSQAHDIEDGEVVYGLLDVARDYDWFHVVAPEGKATLDFRVEAYGSGSPANTRLGLYTADVLTDPDATPVARAFTDESSYDRDPHLQYSTSEAADYYLVIKEADGLGSAFYWYTMSFTVVEEDD